MIYRMAVWIICIISNCAMAMDIGVKHIPLEIGQYIYKQAIHGSSIEEAIDTTRSLYLSSKVLQRWLFAQDGVPFVNTLTNACQQDLENKELTEVDTALMCAVKGLAKPVKQWLEEYVHNHRLDALLDSACYNQSSNDPVAQIKNSVLLKAGLKLTRETPHNVDIVHELTCIKHAYANKKQTIHSHLLSSRINQLAVLYTPHKGDVVTEIDMVMALARHPYPDPSAQEWLREYLYRYRLKARKKFMKADNGASALANAIINQDEEIVDFLCREGVDPNTNDANGRPVLLHAIHNNSVILTKILLAHGADISACDRADVSPLADVVLKKHWQMLKLLLTHKVNIHHVDKRGFCALKWALFFGNLEMMEYLESYGARFKNEDYNLSLWYALAEGKTELIQALLNNKKLDVNKKDVDGITLLERAVAAGQATVVRLLCEYDNGLDITMENYTASLWLAIQRGNEEIINILYEYGDLRKNFNEDSLIVAAFLGYTSMVTWLCNKNIALDAKDKKGATALWHAANHSYHEVIEVLCQHNADINAVNNHGKTPLIIAVENESLATVELLCKKGAQVNIKDYNGQTALWRAVNNRVDQNIVQILCASKADVDSVDQDGQTPLMAAAIDAAESIVTLLCKYGAQLDLKDNSGATAVYWAAACGAQGVVKILCQYGAALDEPDHCGFTPLMIAVLEGHLAVVKTLIEYGAEVDWQNDQGKTAWQLAHEHGQIEIANLLSAYMTDKKL